MIKAIHIYIWES